MAEIKYIKNARGQNLAYRYTPATDASLAGVVFLGGFGSDMEGTKANHLEGWAQAQGRAFLRFDYSGHGSSDGIFTEGCIGEWADDAAEVINAVTDGAQILVGSSMGGWISLILAKRQAVKIAGFIGIATAPDFTEEPLTPAQQAELAKNGCFNKPSDYGEPFVINQKLLDDGKKQAVLTAPLVLDFPVRLLWGAQDITVSRELTLALLDHIQGGDVRLYILKNADHSFSSPEALRLLQKAIHSAIKSP